MIEANELCVTVTFGVIAYNEQQYLPDLLDSLTKQSYPKNLIEVVFVDGGSTDSTKQLMKDFQKEHEREFLSIKIYDNLKRVQPAGWNIVICNSTADIILRIDAHANLPNDFVESNVECINSGEYVCGGPRQNIIDEDTPWKRMLLNAELSLFGAGFASYRQETRQKKYVKSVFHGAYRKEVFNKIGMFNETLIRTEDNEIHYRIRKAGYKICYDPQIRSYYQTRNSLRKMLKQKFSNGFWIGKTLFICPKCISLFHLAPLCFVIGGMMVILLCCFDIWLPVGALLILYCSFLLINTLSCLIKTKAIINFALPILIFLMHVSYGCGTLCGIIKHR